MSWPQAHPPGPAPRAPLQTRPHQGGPPGPASWTLPPSAWGPAGLAGPPPPRPLGERPSPGPHAGPVEAGGFRRALGRALRRQAAGTGGGGCSRLTGREAQRGWGPAAGTVHAGSDDATPRRTPAPARFARTWLDAAEAPAPGSAGGPPTSSWVSDPPAHRAPGPLLSSRPPGWAGRGGWRPGRTPNTPPRPRPPSSPASVSRPSGPKSRWPGPGPAPPGSVPLAWQARFAASAGH